MAKVYFHCLGRRQIRFEELALVALEENYFLNHRVIRYPMGRATLFELQEEHGNGEEVEKFCALCTRK